MAESLIRDVSDTAFMVATYRARETERPDALFRDPLAGKLAGEHGENIVGHLPRQALLGGWFVVIRTCIIDEFIEAAIADGIDTVINLGAGLDTRPYRMNLPASLRWIEVDYAKIIELKESRLAGEKPRCHLERIRLDLADIPARQRLLSQIGSRTAKALVLTEGVIPYLSTDDVASLADDLRGQPAFQYWIVDYLSPETTRFRQRAARRMRMENAPFRFEPKDYFGFFGERGWRAKDMRYILEEANRLNRPPRLPLIFGVFAKLRSLFMAKARREAFRKSAAYVLFEPSDRVRT